MFSTVVAKQGQLALGRGNDETHYSGPEKHALLVVLVDKKVRKKSQTYMAGTKPVTSKQIRDVKKQTRPASVKIENTSKVGLEKVEPPVPARKVKIPATITSAAAGGRFEAIVVTPG